MVQLKKIVRCEAVGSVAGAASVASRKRSSERTGTSSAAAYAAAANVDMYDFFFDRYSRLPKKRLATCKKSALLRTP